MGLVLSAMLTGATFAIAAESVGGLAGWWPVPQHSEVTLAKTMQTLSSLRSRTLAGAVERTRQRVAVFNRSLPYTDSSSGMAFWLRHLSSVLNTVQIVLTRVAILITCAPILAVIFAVAVIDALLDREKRRQSGGRESGFVFHRISKLRGLAFWLPPFVWMAIPLPVSSLFMLAVLPVGYLWTQMVLFKRHV